MLKRLSDARRPFVSGAPPSIRGLPHEYPETWKVWEKELLAPFLKDHPDAIRLTAYES